MTNNHLVQSSFPPEIITKHGLSSAEYTKIISILGREPNWTELGIFSAMWNEHCSYKSSKKWLRTLPTQGNCVIQGPGENAGVVDIGDGDCVIFKMESHNHPSYIEPYQGSATGVGGILRDVFTMGARPIAAMNSLRFGEPEHHRTRYLLSNVAAGIGGYGNAFGVPTIGGEISFDASYNGNILVNAFAAGLAKTDQIFYSKAKGVGLPVVYLGAKTGRDGVGGATMASSEFDDHSAEKRPSVQVGDPFTEKKLLEACLELMKTGAVIAIQDMGAAGLTCSAVEMGAKGDLGIRLNLDYVPVRESQMTAYEMMLSESQERMLMILHPDKKQIAETIFNKWQLDFAEIGETTDDLRFRIFHHGQEVANLPIKELGDMAPEYDRAWVRPTAPSILDLSTIEDATDLNTIILSLLNSANLCSRRWVYEQYDSFIQGNSILRPGGDAGVIRVQGHKNKALAFSSDVTPRYCQADAFEGGKQAVAECWRNLCATGALPLAASDNLNFGNPEKPEIMGQFVLAIQGIGEACRHLDFPIVSGNVSLYNETNGQSILPTPTIAGVGLLEDWHKMLRHDRIQPQDHIFMLGSLGQHLGQSIYLRDYKKITAGLPPKVDLELEKKNGHFVRFIAEKQWANACHDLSDGGLAISLAELCIYSGYGIVLNNFTGRADQYLFAEDQARYLLSVPHKYIDDFINAANHYQIEYHDIGHVEGQDLYLANHIKISIKSLKDAFEGWFARYMSKTDQ